MSEDDTYKVDLRGSLPDLPIEEHTCIKILQIRLSQLKGEGTEIGNFVKLAVESLDGDASSSLIPIRSIAEHAINMAWNAEFPTGVPHEIQDQLLKLHGPHDRGLDKSIFSRTDVHARQAILRRASGFGQDFPKLTKKVTRPTVLLIEHLQNLGNYGQHMGNIDEKEERPADFTFCLSACFACIATLERLRGDLCEQECDVLFETKELP